jgi:ATP-dependent helicase/DNAse subunit B
MTQITYLIGQTVEARKRLLKEEEAIKGSAFKNSLYIVPSRGMAMELEGQQPGWLNRPVDTLTAIISRIFYDDIFYQSFKDFSSMDDALKELAIRVILNKRYEMHDGLKYFFPLFNPPLRNETLPGIYQHILGFFSLLVSNNFEDRFVDQLSRKITSLDDIRHGAGEEKYALDTDLALLFGDYEEFKRNNHLYDNDDIISNVRSFLAIGKSPSLLKNINAIIFDGFITITKIEEEILFYLFTKVDEVLWLLDFDPYIKDPLKTFKEVSGYERDGKGREYEAFRIFISLVSLMERIENAGFLTLIKKVQVEEFKNPFASGLYRSGIYNHGKQNNLKIRSFTTRLDEVREIASEIKKISNLREIDDLSGIRVIFPDLAEYASLIHEIFPEYGIPFNITKGLPLVSFPIATLFKLIIDIPTNGYMRDDIQKFFTSSLISPIMKGMDKEEQLQWLKFLENEGAFFADEKKEDVVSFVESRLGGQIKSQFDISYVDNVARQCGIKKGKIVNDWLPQAREYFFFLFKNSPEKRRRTDILSNYYMLIHQLFHLQVNVKPFEKLLYMKNPKEIVQGLFYLLDTFRIQKNILLLLKDERGLQREIIENIIKRDTQAFNTLKNLAIQTARELEKAELYITSSKSTPLLERFKRGFNSLLARTRIREDLYKGAVDISEWVDIMGCSRDFIFAGGLSADEFPLKEPDDFIIPESSSRHLRKIDLTDQSRHLCSHILCNYTKDLYLSYPKRIKGKDVQPSPVLLDMLSMVKNGSSYTKIEELEKMFPWQYNPYFTGKEEFLNTVEVERKIYIPSKGRPFTHEHIILGADSLQNESIIKSINSYIARNSVDGLSEYDGLVFNAQNFSEYLSNLKDIFSTSRLDMMANCPLRYLFGTIFSLKPIEEVEEELSLRDIGSHVHVMLKMIFDELKKNSENVALLGLSRAFVLAREIGEHYFSHLNYLEGLDFFETQKRDIMDGLETPSTLTENGLPKREGLLARVLRFEEHNLNRENIIALEYRFGDKANNPVMIGKTRIQGYIDRVDKLPGKEDIFLIYDYKTGRTPTLSEVKKGLSFQLPGYISGLTMEKDPQGVMARYYHLKKRSFSQGNPLTPPISFNYAQKTGIDLSGIKLIGDYADRLISLLKRGVFHHSTDGLICSYCEFKYACYKNKRRMDYLIDSGAFLDLYSGKKNLERWKEVENFKKKWKEIQKKMDDSLKIKKEAKRREGFEKVMEFKEWLEENRQSLPFDERYIDQIIEEIEGYQRSF